jgi:hypothetical protein
LLRISDLNTSFTPIADRWGTHVNLLKVIGADAKTVLELGTGRWSTPLFLDRSYYPNLEELVSVENDAEWAETTKTDDPRHRLMVMPEPIEAFLGIIDLDKFDIVMIDNSSSPERRIDTIKYVSTHPSRSMVVMHDYDYAPYRDAVSGFSFALVDDRQLPWTALLCR